AHREVVMIRDPGGDVDLHRLLGAHPALPLALGARLGDHFALARAGGTGRHRHELPEHGAGGPPHLARPAARAAGGGARAPRRTSYASVISSDFASAASFSSGPTRSGWYCIARRRFAFWISASSASRLTPSWA